MSFSFRQRIGRVDWAEIDAVDLESCVNARDTRVLQSLLDMVTFSEITTHELGACGKTVVAKCIQLLQFIVEYLLHTQDAYLRSAQEKAKTIEKLQNTIRGLQQENKTNTEILKWKEKEAAQLKSAFQAAQDVLYELGYGPHIASQRYCEADQVKTFTQAVRQVMTTVSDNHNYQVGLLKDELEQMRSHYEKQLDTVAFRQQEPPAATIPQPDTTPVVQIPERKRHFRNMHAQTPDDFMPTPVTTTVVATSSNKGEALLRQQLQAYLQRQQQMSGRRILQILLTTRRRKVQRRFTMWERHTNALAREEYEQQLRDAHEKRQMLIRAMHKSSKARGNIRDADVNTSISLERPQPVSTATESTTSTAAVAVVPPRKTKLEALLELLLSERQQHSGIRALVAQVLFSGCSAGGLLQEIESRIQGNLARARSEQQATTSVVQALWDELSSAAQLQSAPTSS